MRIGVFGGTFDPVHESHIQMGLDALEQCHLDKVFFVPTRPWQKTARASEEDRAAMLSMALTSYQDKLVVDRRELERTSIPSGKSSDPRLLFISSWARTSGRTSRLGFFGKNSRFFAIF